MFVTGERRKQKGYGMKKKKNKGGRPSKKDTVNKVLLEKLARFGMDDSQIADCIGVTDRTLDNWKKKDPEFFRSLKSWKEEADAKVERSLYESALGFTTKQKKAIVVSDGKEAGSHVEYVHEEIQHAPNSTSIIFWLKNRKPREWRDKQELDHHVKPYLHEKFKDRTPDQLKEEAERLALEIVGKRTNPSRN